MRKLNKMSLEEKTTTPKREKIKVLLMERDEGINNLFASSAFREYNVLHARNVEVALEIFNKRKKDIQVVITTKEDGGLDFARRLRKNSDVPILMTTFLMN
jgi:DNA-binding response OmpR family regulator